MAQKRKRDRDDAEGTADRLPKPTQTTSTEAQQSKGQRKQEKSERRAKKQKRLQEEGLPATEGAKTSSETHPVAGATDVAGENAAEAADEAEDTAKAVSKPKKRKDKKDASTTDKGPARFIVFVGNLPFDATVAEVKEHFAKLSPASVRLSTDKKTGKGKGFAFVEFDGYDKMKTCLSLYHHSTFDPQASLADGAADDTSKKGRGDQKRSRRINVELTAGGGGKKSKERRAKIQTKNIKLDEERQRRRDKERSEREKEGLKKKGAPETGANATAVAREAAQGDRSAIHPSRLSRVSHH